jgi:hypothetical protein
MLKHDIAVFGISTLKKIFPDFKVSNSTGNFSTTKYNSKSTNELP